MKYMYVLLGEYLIYTEAAYHSLGFEDGNLGSSPGWWAATVATYCPSRQGELPKFLANDGTPNSVVL